MATKPVVIALATHKGGTGKTTISLNLAAGLARAGKRVLMVDVDPQASLSKGAGVDQPRMHVGDLLNDAADWDEVLVRGSRDDETLDLLPAHGRLKDSESLILANATRIFALRNYLEDHAGGYDFVIVDCPPSLGPLTTNALIAADYYLVPMQGEHFAYQGLDEMLRYVHKVRKDTRHHIDLLGIVKIKFDHQTVFGREVAQALDDDERLYIFKTQIRKYQGLIESPALGLSIFDYKPRSNGAIDMAALAEEVLHQVEVRQLTTQ